MPRIIICKNMQDYRVIDFENSASIGREQSNEIILDSRGVSRKHALICKQDGVYHLIDQGSKNAVWVGNQISREFTLYQGLSFRIIDYLLTFIDDDPQEIKTKVSPPAAALGETPHGTGNETMLMVNFKLDGQKEELGNLVASSNEYELESVIQHAETLGTLQDEERIIQSMLDYQISCTDAVAGFFALKDKNDELLYRATNNFSPKSDNKNIDHTVIQKVLEDEGCHTAKSFSTQRLGEKSNHSYLCAPFRCEEDIVGCSYLIGKNDKDFSKQDTLLINLSLLYGASRFSKYNNFSYVKNEPIADGDNENEDTDKDVIIRSDNMVRLYSDIKTISTINVPVLILGEPGTGKELVASALHDKSGRKGQYVTLNCSAIPEGIFESELFGSVRGAFHNAADRMGKIEQAHQGTLFLDEIGDMAQQLQPKLLRFLENQELTRLGDTKVRKLDVRIVAATNQNLKEMIQEKRFRADLFQRLSCFSLRIPQLRDRHDDIEPLTYFFLNKFSEEYGLPVSTISPKAIDILKRYQWPGNVRELRNTILRLTVYAQGTVITPEALLHLMDEAENTEFEKVSSFPSLEEMEKKHIKGALKYADWNISDASKMLGIARSTFYKKLKKYEIDDKPS